MKNEVTSDSFYDFYNNTYNVVLKYAICNCKNIDEINDIIQDSYFEIYKKIKYKKINIKNPEAYLITIVKKKIRWKHFKVQYWISLDVEDHPIDINDETLDIESNYINKDNINKIWDYLNKRNELTARIFYLFYILDEPINKIATDMKISESNVKNHLYRSKKDLREYLLKEGIL